MRARRAFVREGEEVRRAALIAAALDLMADGGPAGATVRAIARRAGVTQGLIRYYFGTKEALLAEAYLALMEGMGQKADSAIGATLAPEVRLARFVRANLRPPVVDGRALGLWAGFMHHVQTDPAFRAAHEAGYLRFRDRLERLIADCGVAAPRDAAIALNAVIDGLWLEASALPHQFENGQAERIGARAAGLVVGLDLEAALEREFECATPV